MSGHQQRETDCTRKWRKEKGLVRGYLEENFASRETSWREHRHVLFVELLKGSYPFTNVCSRMYDCLKNAVWIWDGTYSEGR